MVLGNSRYCVSAITLYINGALRFAFIFPSLLIKPSMLVASSRITLSFSQTSISLSDHFATTTNSSLPIKLLYKNNLYFPETIFIKDHYTPSGEWGLIHISFRKPKSLSEKPADRRNIFSFSKLLLFPLLMNSNARLINVAWPGLWRL